MKKKLIIIITAFFLLIIAEVGFLLFVDKNQKQQQKAVIQETTRTPSIKPPSRRVLSPGFIKILAQKEILRGITMSWNESVDGQISRIEQKPYMVDETRVLADLYISNSFGEVILKVAMTQERMGRYVFYKKTSIGRTKIPFKSLEKGQKIKTTIVYTINEKGNSWGPEILNNELEIID